MIKWWNKRKENAVAWRVKVKDLKRGFDLDVKNPNSSIEERGLSVHDCLYQLKGSLDRVETLLGDLETVYATK